MFQEVDLFHNLPMSARRAYSTAKQRAKKNNQEILTHSEFVALWNRAAGKCELSGIRFSDDEETGEVSPQYKRKSSFPWQPSIGQIRPGFGYQAANYQLDCKAVNIGKNGYQPETFETWVRAVAQWMQSRTYSSHKYCTNRENTLHVVMPAEVLKPPRGDRKNSRREHSDGCPEAESA